MLISGEQGVAMMGECKDVDNQLHRITLATQDTTLILTMVSKMAVRLRFSLFTSLQCFDAVGWAAGRASGL